MIHRDRDTEGGLRPEAGYATSNLRILNPGRAENARPFIARDAQWVFLMTVPGGGPGGGWILETGRLAGCRGCTAPRGWNVYRIIPGRRRRSFCALSFSREKYKMCGKLFCPQLISILISLWKNCFSTISLLKTLNVENHLPHIYFINAFIKRKFHQ